MSTDDYEYFCGPLPATDFLAEFMPATRTSQRPDINFNNIPYETGSADDISSLLMHRLRESRILHKYQCIDASKPDPFLSRDAHPGLLVYPPGFDFWQSEADAWRALEMPIFVLDSAAPSYAEAVSSEVREKMEKTIAAQITRQQRIFVFSVMIWRNYVCFLRWDRAGCLISLAEDFLEKPYILADFFWRFNQLSRAARGFDPTATDATSQQARYLKAAVRKFIKESHRDAGFLRPTLDDDYPVYKVVVDGLNGDKMKLIVGKPFHVYPDAFDRATRVYAAYLIAQKKLVVLKDFWRSNSLRHVISEAEMYEHLQQYNVPHLPTNLAAGDVFVDGQRQQTSAQAYEEGLYGYTKERIVQEIVFPLTSIKSSKELTQVMRDTVKCMSVAYHSAQVLHQDISSGNIMVTQEGRGIVNDWDSAWRLMDQRAIDRPGTWSFMSIDVCAHPFKEHHIRDDLESCFWLLLWTAIHHIKAYKHWTRRNWEVFNSRTIVKYKEGESVPDPDGGDYSVGGYAKFEFLIRGQMEDLEWQCQPFDIMIHDLGKLFSSLHSSRVTDDRERPASEHGATGENEKVKAQYQEMHLLLSYPENVLRVMDKSLAKGDWLDYDAVPDMFPSKSQIALKADAAAPNLETDGGKKSQQPCGRATTRPRQPAIALRKSTRTKKQTGKYAGTLTPAPSKHKRKAPDAEDEEGDLKAIKKRKKH